jgi:phosphate transport system protein
MEVRHKFNEQMSDIYQQILRMGALIEEALQKSLSAIKQHDEVLAQQVIDQDVQIDEFQTRIEDLCTMVIATEQPVASDLREIVTMIKVVSDLERIGDHARHLAKAVSRVREQITARVLPHLERMTNLGIGMVHNALTALANRDAEQAKLIVMQDDDMDRLNSELQDLLVSIMKQSPDLIEEGTTLIFINRLLERLGDHVTNMCEWIIYARQGSHTVDTRLL